ATAPQERRSMTSGTDLGAGRPLLATKLHVPRPRQDAVRRERLTDRLSAPDATVTLISAPAGFGKTSLLADWLAGSEHAGSTTAWLALDDADNDPDLFWIYVVAAVQRAAPDVGAGATAELHASQPLPSVVA